MAMIDLGKFLARAAILCGAALCSTGGIAATVIGTLQSVGAGDTITLHAIRPNGTPMAQQVLLGVSTFSRTGGDAAALVGNAPGSFLAFCVEPFEDASLNASYSFNTSPMASAANSSISGGIGATRAGQISTLFGQFAPNLASPMSALQASALQVALWEIVSELSTNPFDVLSGNTYFGAPGGNTTNVLNLAQTYLNYVGTAGGSAPQAQGLLSLTNNGHQDFLVQVVTTAPEPGTWLMMILGFGMVGNAMRRRRGTVSRPQAV